MAFHLSHIHDYDRFAAVDIGSSRVRTWVYSIESLEGELLGFSSVRQNRKNMLAGSIADMRWVALTIERSLIQASQKIDEIPSDVILGFSSSQIISDVVTTQYIRKSWEPITMREIDTMVKKIEKSSFDRVRTKAKNIFGITHDDLKLISSTITSIEIDGKTVTNPIWFTGTKVRLSLLNLFAPASEFNIVRSVAAHIGKNIISLIPIPLVYPKILEKHDYIDRKSCVIDMGLHHTTVICIEDNQIIALETFPIGTEMLMEWLAREYSDLTLLQIEHMIANDEYHDARLMWVKGFLEYILDTFHAYLREDVWDFQFDSLFVHGSIFSGDKIMDVLRSLIIDAYSSKVRIMRFADIVDAPADEVVPYGLSLIATELLMVKKDPLVRILRYVLYNYE